MLAFSALIAGSFALGALTVPHINPTAFNTARFILAALVVCLLAAGKASISVSAFVAPWRYVLLGGLMGFYFVLMFEALKTTSPVSASAVFTLTPILSGLFGYILLRQITTRRMALALSIGALGALWVIFRADLNAFFSFDPGRGEMIFFVGCIAHALYAPMVQLVNRGESPVVFSFGALVAAALLLMATSWKNFVTTDWSGLPLVVWVTIIYTAVFATAATFILIQYALLRLPSAKVMAYTYLTPFWVICWEAALGHELPKGLILGGVVFILLALALLLKDEHSH